MDSEQGELQALRQEVAMYRSRLRYLEKWQHEFRGPMGAIIGYPLLLLDDQLEPLQQEALEAIRDSGDWLLQTVQDFFTYISAETGQIEINPMPFELTSVLEEAMVSPKKLAAERSVNLDYQIVPGTLQTIVSSRSIVRQVITHLTNHSVKCSPNGQVTVTAESKDSKLKIRIEDTGAGYKTEAKRQLQRLFASDEVDPENFDGMEIRLVMCKRLCDFVDGRLEVDSNFKQGTTYTFTIPSESEIILGH